MYQDEIKTLKSKLKEAQDLLAKTTNERDIALQQLKEYEEKIKKAEKASKMKSLFLANMSHEIRTPLNAIIGLVTLAIASIDDSAKVQDCLKKINFSSKHLLMLINDILDMSQI